ncbi:major facilitator superfamily transporter [Tritrichomonas foetus]|uniref:Major facilitator superfamily transporter n=1 Tax=Tritrichomonas foetus TaxID=1144522 RepID=A0A1J4JAL9_9EUKA|nr:major facilitator superfamily transporter [Tritrichomonas foetus]|eukprot:OHS96200.1 major facilitator superfamily transporter [Tritrichomonas foetus]
MGFFSITLVYALILLLGSFSFGYIVTYASPAVPAIQKIMDISTLEATLFNAIAALFAIFGATLATILINIGGKKLTVFATSLTGAIFWIALPFMTLKNIWLGILGRAILGVVTGSFSVVIPLCIHEIAPVEYLGIYGSLSQFGITVGCMTCYLISDLLDWRQLTYFEAVVCGLFCFLIWIVPLKDQTTTSENLPKESVFQKKYLPRLMIGIGAMYFQQFSGINAILTNLNSLFEKAGLDLSTGLASGIAASAQVIAVIVGGVLIQKLGRKFVWVLSLVGAAVSITLYGLTLKFPSWPGIIPVITIFLYLLTFGVGLGPIPWFIVPELFPPSVSSAATSTATVANWLCAFTVIFSFKYLQEAIGDFMCMILFMIVCAGGAVFGWFFVGETTAPVSEALLSTSGAYESIADKFDDKSF